MKSLAIVVIFILIGSMYAQSNINNDKNIKDNSEVISNSRSTKDTVFIRDTIYVSNSLPHKTNKALDTSDNYYLSILEKTNSQLSLWINPYGILVAALAVLFTIMTIIAAVVLYRQGKEYQTRQSETEKNYKDKLEEFLNEKREQIKITEESYRKLIEEYTQKLEKVGAEQKKEIQKTIDDLNNRKNDIKTFITASVPAITRNYHKCSSCGFGFEVINDSLHTSGIEYFTVQKPTSFYLGSRNETKTVTCPKCGNLDTV